jgi:hypothetical protein
MNDDTIVLSAKTREEFRRALDNSVRHCKRSLLEFLEFQKGQHEELAPLCGYLMRRVHNDVSIIKDQVGAAFEIVCNGGAIPAFGRTDEEQERRTA